MHPGKVVCNVFLVVFTCCSLTLSEAASDLINPKTSSKQFAISQNEVSYKDPQWLQDVPWASGAAKYRKRRFLSFPTGSALAITMAFAMPVLGIGSSSSLALSNTINFVLPNTTDYSFLGRAIAGRSDRLNFFDQFEEFLGGFGLDGHECTLRSICEVAEMPFEHGLVGEMINLVFSVLSFTEGMNSDNHDDYTRAEYHGKYHGNCAELYPGCISSVTNMISNTI